MSMYLIIISFIASWSFVGCPNTPLTELSMTVFNQWQCTSLCDNERNRPAVVDKCASFVDSNLEEAYDVDKIRAESRCKRAFVILIDEGKEKVENAHVGICYLSPKISICISAALDPKDLLLWSHDQVSIQGLKKPVHACRPKEILEGQNPCQ